MEFVIPRDIARETLRRLFFETKSNVSVSIRSKLLSTIRTSRSSSATSTSSSGSRKRASSLRKRESSSRKRQRRAPSRYSKNEEEKEKEKEKEKEEKEEIDDDDDDRQNALNELCAHVWSTAVKVFLDNVENSATLTLCSHLRVDLSRNGANPRSTLVQRKRLGEFLTSNGVDIVFANVLRNEHLRRCVLEPFGVLDKVRRADDRSVLVERSIQLVAAIGLHSVLGALSSSELLALARDACPQVEVDTLRRNVGDVELINLICKC
jgi:hypothetical protein